MSSLLEQYSVGQFGHWSESVYRPETPWRFLVRVNGSQLGQACKEIELLYQRKTALEIAGNI